MRIFRYVIKTLKIFLITVCAILFIGNTAFIILLETTDQEWLGASPNHPSMDVRLQETHQIQLLDVGHQSLKARLALLDSAQESIEMEFFIYELDGASRIITDRLMKKARQGVQIRLLVDFAAPVFKLGPSYAEHLRKAGIQVRYYNTTPPSRFFAVQHRSHRKILAVDNATVILGGRNIANDYFDLSSNYNFLDSDVIVTGPIVKSIGDSFDLYWNSDWTTASSMVEIEEDFDSGFFQLTTQDKHTLDTLNTIKAKAPTFTCNDVQFVTDYPGSGVERRHVYDTIVKLSMEAKKSVILESPYFVLRQDGLNDFKRILDRGVTVEVLTNTLRSSDAYYVVAALLPLLPSIGHDNFKLYAYKGNNLDGAKNPFAGSSRWGVHSKRGVIDEKTFIIGSYNIDPRSANFNSELILICRNQPELAAAALNDIEERMKQSIIISGEGEQGISGVLADAPAKKILQTFLIMPLAWLFNYLL